MKEIAVYLESLGWKPRRERSETIYYSPDEQLAVVLGEWWELRHFTDGDVDTDSGPRAVGRYVLDEEGESLDELREAMRGVRV